LRSFGRLPGARFAGFFAATRTTAGFYLINTFVIAYRVDRLAMGGDVGCTARS
jgi:hypothetical protein